MAENMPRRPPPPPSHLTEIPARASASGGTYKHHKHLGHAKNAVLSFGRYGYDVGNEYGPAKIYEWNFQADQWDLVFDIPEGTREEDLPWKTKG